MAPAARVELRVFGLINDISFQICRCCAEDLSKNKCDKFTTPVINGMLEFEWNEYLESHRRTEKGEAWNFEGKAVVFEGTTLIGGPHEFLTWAENEHNYEDFRPLALYQTLAEKEYQEHLCKNGRTYCYLNVTIGDKPMGRLLIELYTDVVPKTSENFRAMCTGEHEKSVRTDLPLTYKNSLFHRIVKNGWVQGGDSWAPYAGDGGESIYGPVFEDENFIVKHDRRGVVGMANKGRHSNGSQFYITLQPTSWMDTNYVAFGQVVEGTETLKALEQEDTFNERPKRDIRISESGRLSIE